MNKRKNKHAVALGKLGGAAGKGSPARKRAARKAARARWRKQKECQPPKIVEIKV